MMKKEFEGLNAQKGATLIVALVMLLVLTLLAVAAMESSVVEERMAGNALDRNVAFQAAESALRDAETTIFSFPEYSRPVNGSGTGIAIRDSLGGSDWWLARRSDANWWENNTREYSPNDDDVPGVSRNPRYVIEEYDDVCDSTETPTLEDCLIVYRITAIAWGGRNTSVMLQSLYSRRY